MRRPLAALLLAAALPAGAATFVATSVEQAARSAEAVVRARVASATSRVTRDGRRVVTDVELTVLDAWKGAAGSTVRLVVPGGSTGKVAMWVDAAPTFEPGEEVVVFISREGPAWQVMGLGLGKYRVRAGEARPGLAGATVLPRPLPAGERQVGAMPLAELERRVRAAR